MSDPRQTFTLAEIRAICMAYDQKRGQYPETEFEGKSLFEFIIGRALTPEEYKDWCTETGWE